MIVAGEASGDMHGANLVREMLKIDPALNFYGIGGNKLREEGVKLLANASDYGCCRFDRGYFQIRKYFKNNGYDEKILG